MMGLGGTEKVIIQLCKILVPQVHKIVVCSTDGIMVPKLKSMGVIHYKIPDITDKSPYNVIRILHILSKIIKKENITVIHAHHRMAAFYAMILHKKYDFIFIATAHNTFHDKKLFTRLSYHKCNIIACGEMVKQNLTDYYNLSASNVSVIHNAVSSLEKNIIPDKTLQAYRQSGYFLIGNIGRLSQQKGMKFFIQACAYIKKSVGKIKFIIVGEGEERDDLKRQVQELGLSEDIIFLGYRQDIQDIIGQLDFIVLSSLWEGLPLTPLEAFSMGKTVVATNVDGTVEEVVDGYNGLLVPPANSHALADAMLSLYTDDKKRIEYAGHALETYRTQFSFDSYRDKMIGFYKSL